MDKTKRFNIYFIFFLYLFLISPQKVFSAQDFILDFTYPSFEGDFYVSGTVSFPPSSVESEDNLIVKIYETKEEIPTNINIQKRWQDNSLLSAEIIFVANFSEKKQYELSYGREIKRFKSFSKTAVLPIISFSIRGAPKIQENLNVDVGQINVRVDKSPGFYYYWHIIPIIFIVTLTYGRYRKTKSYR